MKIKHFQGYGTVDAKKISNKKVNDFENQLIIKVTGNHECGIARHDVYDVYNWLVKRFDKTVESYRDISALSYTQDEEMVNGVSTDTCTYYINTFRK